MMTDFKFEIMDIKDLSKVVEIEKESHLFPWSEKNCLDCIDNSYWNYVLLDNSSERNILGHCIVMPGVEELHLLNITISPQYRRCQIASRTLNAIEETGGVEGYERILLEVRRSNTVAIDLYKKLGYQLIGARKNYYPSRNDDGKTREDALVMERVLKTK